MNFNLFFISRLLPYSRAWWDQVTEIPDDRRMIVFRRGIWKGFIAETPIGGQIFPISMFGARLLWKNIQKKDTKNNTSETINRIIPIRSPFMTFWSWYPWNLLSRATSRHQVEVTKINKGKLILIGNIYFFLIIKIKPPIRFNLNNPLRRGQGLGEIMWKGWYWFNISYRVSLKYIDKSITKTYLWINATANSRIRSTIRLKLVMLRIKIELLASAIKICPAVMFAHNRTDRVIGRMIWLMVSIIVINWDRAKGVDRGTKWLKKWLVFFLTENRIILIHTGKAKLNLKSIWLVTV